MNNTINNNFHYNTNNNNVIINNANINNNSGFKININNDMINNNLNYYQNCTSQQTINNEGGEEDSIKEKEKNMDIPTTIRKYKKAVRRLKKLKLLYQEMGEEESEEKEDDSKKDTKKGNGKRACINCMGYVAFIMVILTDFLLPLFFNYQDGGEWEDEDEGKEGILILIISLFLLLFLTIFYFPYTIISFTATIRRRYITGDFLYDKKINDHISLMKTVQIVCGYSFTIIYCNLYFWKATDKLNYFGKPKFYEETIIPDYIIKNGFGVYMIIKLVIIIGSIIFTLCGSKVFIFKNDLGELYTSKDKYKYENEEELKNTLKYYPEVDNFLKKA